MQTTVPGTGMNVYRFDFQDFPEHSEKRWCRATELRERINLALDSMGRTHMHPIEIGQCFVHLIPTPPPGTTESGFCNYGRYFLVSSRRCTWMAEAVDLEGYIPAESAEKILASVREG